MTKRDGQYTQIQPALHIDSNSITPIELGGSFTYLGKSFMFSMNKESMNHMKDAMDRLQVRTANSNKAENG